MNKKYITFVIAVLLLCLAFGFTASARENTFYYQGNNEELTSFLADPQWQQRLHIGAASALDRCELVKHEQFDAAKLKIQFDQMSCVVHAWTLDDIKRFIESDFSADFIDTNFPITKKSYEIPFQYEEHHHVITVPYLKAYERYTVFMAQEKDTFLNDLALYSLEEATKFINSCGLEQFIPKHVIYYKDLAFIICQKNEEIRFVYFPQDAQIYYLEVQDEIFVNTHHALMEEQVLTEDRFYQLMEQYNYSISISNIEAPADGNSGASEQQVVIGEDALHLPEEQPTNSPSTEPNPQNTKQPEEEHAHPDLTLLWVIAGAVVLIGGLVTVLLIVKKKTRKVDYI